MGEPIRWPSATVIMALTPTVALHLWWPSARLGAEGSYLLLPAAAVVACVCPVAWVCHVATGLVCGLAGIALLNVSVGNWAALL